MAAYKSCLESSRLVYYSFSSRPSSPFMLAVPTKQSLESTNEEESLRHDLRPYDQATNSTMSVTELLGFASGRSDRINRLRFRQPLPLTKAGTPNSALAACCDKSRLSEAYNVFLAHSENKVLLSSFEAPRRRMPTESFDTPACQQMSRTLKFRIRLSTSAFSRSAASGMVDSCSDWKAHT